MDIVYPMDEATLFDSFFNYLQQIDVFDSLEHLDPQKQKRKNIPFFTITLVFLMKVVGAIKTIDETSDLLLTDEVLTTLVGVPDLLTCDWLNPQGSKVNSAKKDYVPIALNAVVVKTGDNKNFLKWQEQQLQLEALGKQSTWQMYRRKLKVLNRNKLIVFVGQHFGIFPSHEVFMLANVPVHKTEKELNINREQVYARYTDVPVAENT